MRKVDTMKEHMPALAGEPSADAGNDEIPAAEEDGGDGRNQIIKDGWVKVSMCVKNGRFPEFVCLLNLIHENAIDISQLFVQIPNANTYSKYS